MKRQLYDLTDEPFVMFVDRLNEVLKGEEIRYNVVGGVASQAYILDMLSKKHDSPIDGLVRYEDVRIQDYLRSTDDVDIALDLKGEEADKMKTITTVIIPKMGFEGISPDGESLVEFRSERVGASRPRFRVYVNDQGTQEEVIAMNIGRKPSDIRKLDPNLYGDFINQGRYLRLEYSEDFSLNLHVPRLEHVLASKLSQSRAKDLMDVRNLTTLAKDTGRELDFQEIERVLLERYPDEYERFLSEEYPDLSQ
jgi:hypothetical protein